MRVMVLIAGACVVALPAGGLAQSSSILHVPILRTADGGVVPAPYPSETKGSAFAVIPPKIPTQPSTRAIEMSSMIAVRTAPPRKFKPHDLITIIVRQHKLYEADGKFDREKKWQLNAKLSKWFRFHDDLKHLGTDQLSNGQPGVKFDLNDKYETDGQAEREDRFNTRLQAEVIDVKPNGNLVLEARIAQQHDEERFEITLTGMCRSEDVTATNSILSTQIAYLDLTEKNRGFVRDANTRGWIPRFLDLTNPF